METENNLFVILDTSLSQELIEEGLARELISKVQQLRKANDFEMMDNIRISLKADEAMKQAVEAFRDYIMNETLALELEYLEDDSLEEFDINDHLTGIGVTRLG